MAVFYFTYNINAEDYTQLKKKYEKAGIQNRSEILLRMARIDMESKRFENALLNAQEAYTFAEAHGQKKEAAQALISIGAINLQQNLIHQSLDNFLHAEAIGAAVFDKEERFYLHLSLAKVYILLGEQGNADERFLSARQLMYDLKKSELRAVYFFEHALAYKALSKERAYSDLSDALSSFDKNEKKSLKGSILLEKAKLSRQLFGTQQAISDAELIIDYAQTIPSVSLKIEGELFISSLYIEIGELENALDALYSVIESAQSIDNHFAEAKAYAILGGLFEDLRYKEKAIEYFKKAITLFEKDEKFFEKTTTLLLLSKLLLENEMYPDAKLFSSQALEYAEKYEFYDLFPFCLLYQGILQIHDNAIDTAIATLMTTQETFTKNNNFEGIAETYYALSVAYEKKGMPRKALKAIDDAILISKNLQDNSADTLLKIVARAGTLYSQKGNHKIAVSYFEQYAAMKNRQDILLQKYSERQLRFESEQNKKEIQKMEKIQRSKERSIIVHRLFLAIGIAGIVLLSILLFKKGINNRITADITLDSTFMTKYKLSEREQEIIQLIALGHTNKEVSSTLFIAEGTVKQHMNTIFKKMHVRNRIELLNALKGYSPPATTGKGKSV